MIRMELWMALGGRGFPLIAPVLQRYPNPPFPGSGFGMTIIYPLAFCVIFGTGGFFNR